MGTLAVILALLGLLTLVVFGIAICVSSSDHIPGVNEPRTYTRNRK